MSAILDLIDTAPAALRAAPMPRHKITRAHWEQTAEDVAGGHATLLSLWADTGAVHMALMNETSHATGIVSYANRRGGFPSVGRLHAPALRLERAVQDLFGYEPQGTTDPRPWLDHGRWAEARPMGRPGGETAAHDYDFLPVEGESLHQVPVGPVHAGIIEPGHFRFTAHGETVVRLEERLGYTHKGVDRLMRGATLARGAELAGRVSGDSTVAFGWAYAQAAEAALGVTVPPRALGLRAVMAELERLANHLGDIGAICNDAAFPLMLAQCAVLREQVLRAAASCFGSRAMRDLIVPGGVACDPDAAGMTCLHDLLAGIRAAFPAIVELYDNTASLLDRTVGTGTLAPDLARRFGAGGVIGRASGRDFDARRDLAYAPYDGLGFEVPARDDGDVNARVWLRIHEVEQCLVLIHKCLARLPAGPVIAAVDAAGEPREGLGIVEGFRGDILIWLRLDAWGRIGRCHMRDPSWFQWPLLEAVIEDNIIADFPLCNKSFNCSYSGHDL